MTTTASPGLLVRGPRRPRAAHWGLVGLERATFWAAVGLRTHSNRQRRARAVINLLGWLTPTRPRRPRVA